MKYITIDILQWDNQPIFLFIQRGQIPFEDASEFLREWTRVYTYQLYAPLYRPIPKGYDLYLAERRDAFPYNTIRIIKQTELFNPVGKGVYFLANEKEVQEMKDILKS